MMRFLRIEFSTKVYKIRVAETGVSLFGIYG